MTITDLIANSINLPKGAVPIGAVEHPTRPDCGGLLVMFAATGLYSLATGDTLVSVPQSWAKQMHVLGFTRPLA